MDPEQREDERLPSGLALLKEQVERLEEILGEGPQDTDGMEACTRIPRTALQALLRAMEAEGLIYENTDVQDGWWVPVKGGVLDDRPPAPEPVSAERMARCGIVDRGGIVGTIGMTLKHRLLDELAEGGRDAAFLAKALKEHPATIERILRTLKADGIVEETSGRISWWSLACIIQAEKAAGGIHVWFGAPRPLVPEWVRQERRDRKRSAR
jgi:DNA-binding transcriptional ArsR family regulator